MKAVILAGGLGTRLSEETSVRPKPMVEIGGKPILWHIMKIYAAHNINEFIICCGYKGYVIKEFFANYFLHTSDVTFDVRGNKVKFHNSNAEPWKVTLVDTGDDTMTGGRLRRVKKFIGRETFCMTYGDGVTDLNIGRLIAFHKAQRTLATLTAVQPPGRFGAFTLPDRETKVHNFREKVKGDGAWINGGFFVLDPRVLDHIRDDSTVWEQEPMVNLSAEGMLSAYKHHGYWQSMDTLRDKSVLEELWHTRKAPWKIW
ncbi:MAG: glucose-1-phosphate cytidylyltransferase [Nitrospira sp.]|nr:MAG: glucose-1-phosphate cytidylyltransferase [Nitrospira sp.]